MPATFRFLEFFRVFSDFFNSNLFIFEQNINRDNSNSCFPELGYDVSPTRYRPVASGGAGGARALPLFGRSVNPISSRGGTFSPPSITCPPQIFRPCDGPEIHSTKFSCSVKKEIKRNITIDDLQHFFESFKKPSSQ